jgi:hypothetical protein
MRNSRALPNSCSKCGVPIERGAKSNSVCADFYSLYDPCPSTRRCKVCNGKRESHFSHSGGMKYCWFHVAPDCCNCIWNEDHDLMAYGRRTFYAKACQGCKLRRPKAEEERRRKEEEEAWQYKGISSVPALLPHCKLALFMSQHDRLGATAPVRVLHADLLLCILNFVDTNKDLTTTHLDQR